MKSGKGMKGAGVVSTLNPSNLLGTLTRTLRPSTQALQKSKKELGQIVGFGAAEGVARFLNWGMMAILPFVLGSASAYGEVGLLVSIEVLVSNVSLMGLDRAVLVFYSRDQWPRKLMGSILLLWAALSVIPPALVLIPLAAGWSDLFGVPVSPHLLVLALTIAMLNLNLICVSIGRAKHLLHVFLFFRLTYILLKFIAVLAMAALVDSSVCYVAGGCVAAFLILPFTATFLRKKSAGGADRLVVGELLLFGWPFVFHTLSINVISYFSRFTLEAYNSSEAVGIFTFAYTLGSALHIGYAGLSMYFETKIYSCADDTVRGERWLYLYLNVCMAFATACATVLIVAYPYLAAFFSPAYAQALPTISVIMGSILLSPLYLQGNYRLTWQQRTRRIAGASFLSACLSIALNYALVPRYGIWGGGVAMYVSTLLLSISTWGISIRSKTGDRRYAASCGWSSVVALTVCLLGSSAIVVFAEHEIIAAFVMASACLISCALVFFTLVNLGEKAPNQC